MKFRVFFENDEHGSAKHPVVEIVAATLTVSGSRRHIHAITHPNEAVLYFAERLVKVHDDKGHIVWLGGEVYNEKLIRPELCRCA